MIEITNLIKEHGANRILDGISLQVKPGEVAALVGPSGGGKSTLIRCINGLETFQGGTIQVRDLQLQTNGNTPKEVLLSLRRIVGMVFQQFNLFPHMSVIENVMCGPRYVLKLSHQQAREIAKPLLHRVGLLDKADAKPSQLSGGQQQRVAIARALAVRPDVILFDEPTSALDPALAAEVTSVIADLATAGQTMLVVTHSMDLARKAHVVHRLEKGRIVSSESRA